jgi:flagellar L-ring protein FlgH
MTKLFKSLCKWSLVATLLAPLGSSAQSLWKEETSKSLLADKKANAVGDILTILVQQSNSTTKDNSTSTSKKSSIDSSLSSLLINPATSSFFTKNNLLPSAKMSGASTFDGSGKISNTEQITDKISVHVIDVLPNGNMVIEGTRQTSFAGESQQAVLRGVVRSEDVTAANTIYSYNISDASIKFIGKGVISDSQNKNWFVRLWDKVSPF